MEGLFNLREDTIDDFLTMVNREPRDSVIAALRIAIYQMPSAAEMACRLVDRMLREDSSYLEPISDILLSTTSDDVSTVSRAVYLTYLGAPSALAGVGLADSIVPVSQHFAECHETVDLPALFAKPRVLGEAAGGFLDVFYCYAIMKNIAFYKLECCYRLRGFPHYCIIEAMLIDESLTAISMAVELCRVPGFFALLSEHIHHFSRRAEITSLIFVVYYRIRPVPNTEAYVCMRGDEDKQALKRMFDRETERFCLKIGNRARLNVLLGTNYTEPKLPVMSRSDFMHGEFPTQEAFFDAFLAVSSPSVSHFFNYMELYKDRFVLDAAGQRQFVNELKKFHAENRPYLDIVLPKLVKFKIIGADLI